MPLDLLRKDVIDDTIVRSVSESAVKISHDKSVVNLFEVPLSNIIPNQSNSPETNFHGINLSAEKYTAVPENLTHFIAQNRKMEQEGSLNSSNEDEIQIIEDQSTIAKQNDAASLSRNLDTNCPDKNVSKNMHAESKDVEVIDYKEVEIVSENKKVPLLCRTDKIRENVLNVALSPMPNSSRNTVLASTPRFIRNVPNFNYNSGVATYFEKSGIHLSPTAAVSQNNDMNLATEIKECSESTTNNFAEVIQSKLHNDNVNFNEDSTPDNRNMESNTVPEFIAPKSLTLSPILTTKSKRELFVMGNKKSDTNNNKNKLKTENNTDLQPLTCKTGLSLDQHKCSADEIDIEQLININDKDTFDLFKDKIENKLCDSVMSIEEEALSNSFLNMSVDDTLNKHDLLRSAKKKVFRRIEVENKAEKCDIVVEEVKSYQLPFVSSNPEENEDNNNNEWNYLKYLETDEERYRVVRSVWKNMHVPDPNVNLSCFNFYQKSEKSRGLMTKPQCSNTNVIRTDFKRQREESDDQGPMAKRRKLFNNVNFFNRTLNETKRIVENDFKMDEYTLRRNFRNSDKLRGRFFEKMDQLESVRNEVEAIHSFYKGLPNQTEHDQQIVEREQMNVNKLYDKFRNFYNWSGRAFSHAIYI